MLLQVFRHTLPDGVSIAVKVLPRKAAMMEVQGLQAAQGCRHCITLLDYAVRAAILDLCSACCKENLH